VRVKFTVLFNVSVLFRLFVSFISFFYFTLHSSCIVLASFPTRNSLSESQLFNGMQVADGSFGWRCLVIFAAA